MLKDIDIAAVRECVRLIQKGAVEYRLVRAIQPYLEMEPDQPEVPECLKTSLPRIPVPREIFFRTLDRGEPRCFSARVNIEADEVLGMKLPKARWALRIGFPLAVLPEETADTKRLIAAWALTAFFRDQPGGATGSLPSQYVPERLCQACMGRKTRDLKASFSEAPLWP